MKPLAATRVFWEATATTSDPVRDLAVAVVTQCVRDLKGSDLIKSLDALVWLTGNDAPVWLDVAGLPDVNLTTFITSGRARRLQSRSILG